MLKLPLNQHFIVLWALRKSHNANYVVSFCLYDKTQTFNLPVVLHTSGHDIDPGGVDTAVAQNVGQLGDILLDAVEGSGEQLPQVMGKYL